MLPTDEMPPIVEDELTVLKERADVLGIKYHTSISAAKLKEKIEAHLAGTKPADQAAGSEDAPQGETPAEKILRLKKNMLALVRVRLSCLNPAKKEWEGEIITVGNAVIPSLKKFVPFTGHDDGYHLPRMMLNQLRERQCQVFHTVKDDRGNKVRRGKLIKEFAIEELPPLTPEELKDLAQRQAVAQAID